MEPNAVELIGIYKSFKSDRQQEVFAIDNLNLQIKTSEFFSILGPSGCGKTTTLRAIAGFEMPTAGEIYIYGEPMGNKPPFHRPVNTVFQNYALFPHLTVAENVAFGLEMENLKRREIKSRVAEVLDLVKLTDLGKRNPRQLSGGQQQRVALARALVKQPKVLLFDEPLGALDLKLRKEIQLELKRMQQQLGITFIYVTHDREEALTMSDRIAVMSRGQLQQVGSPVEIYERPASRFVAEFIGESNFLIGRVVEPEGEGIVVLVDEKLRILVSGGEEMAAGRVVTLVVRPEKIGIYPQNYDGKGSFLGVVKEVIYIGTDTRYLVRISEQSLIGVRCQNLNFADSGKFAVGDAVKLRISPDSVRVIGS
ncbi:MAG: ABC transporter ATP-binding protein [Cyanobacteriota bacterium]|nr:ABC transporter ATP-binding protein [Cyanobacteriota bacterium]